jgi:hypothetical protein
VSVEVRIVDAVTRVPIPGADVWWKDASCDELVDALPKAERRPFIDDEERVCRTFGWQARSNERGCVRVHADGAGTTVIARSEGRWGSGGVDVTDAARGVELALRRDLEVTVRVVDAAGQPVPEVPVDLDHWSGMETDATGLVVFQHLQFLADRVIDGALVPAEEGAYVAIPGLPRDRTTFPLLSPPKEPLVLVLPASGEVHVRVLHPGRAVESVAAQLQVADDDAQETTWSRRADADGVVRFRHLPLALSYELEVSIGDFSMERTIEGPKNAGHVVLATFELPDDAIALSGRIATRDGQPVASTDLRIHMSPSPSSVHFFTTDEHGRFLWHLPGSIEDPPGRRLEELRVTWRRGPCDTLRGSVARRRLEAGVNDLGEIRLDHRPLVVAGRFMFDRPADRDDVEICIERWWTGRGANPGYWQRVEDLDADHDREGCFVVRGNPPPGRLRLCCGDYTEPVEFERGATDLVIEFVRGHSVTAWLSVQKGVPFEAARYPAQWFHMALTREGEHAAERVLPVSGYGCNGKADFRPLVAGTYRLDVRLGNLAEVLASQQVVLPGPDGELARSIDIDLRDRLEVLRLRFLDNGEPAAGERFVFVDQQLGASPLCGYIASGGVFALPITPRAVDLTILSVKHEPVFLHSVRGSIDVQLTARATVQLIARGLPQLGGHQEVGVAIAGDAASGPEDKITVYAAGQCVRTFDYPELFGRGSCHASLDPDAVGEVRAALRDRAIAAEFRGRRTSRALHAFSPKVVPAGTAPVTITFDPAEIRAAIEADENAGKWK